MGIKDYHDIKNPYLKWLRKHLVVLVGFMGFGSYEGVSEFYDAQVNNGIRHQKVDKVILKIIDNKAFDKIDRKNRQQDRRIKDLESEFIIHITKI